MIVIVILAINFETFSQVVRSLDFPNIQKARYFLKNIVKYSNEKDTTKTSYKFNDKGHILLVTAEKFKNNQWINSTRSTYIRDDFGNELSRIDEIWQ
jgi:hypothetical protein